MLLHVLSFLLLTTFWDKISVFVYPILHMRDLDTKKLSNLPKEIKQLVNSRARIQIQPLDSYHLSHIIISFEMNPHTPPFYTEPSESTYNRSIIILKHRLSSHVALNHPVSNSSPYLILLFSWCAVLFTVPKTQDCSCLSICFLCIEHFLQSFVNLYL